MAEETRKVEIGFEGGQVINTRLADGAVKELRKALDSDDPWLDLENDDGTLTIDLERIVFVRVASGKTRVGF